MLDAPTKTALGPVKTASKKIVGKIAEATGVLIGKKLLKKL